MTSRSPRFSTLGRPRKITDAQVAEILAWYDQPRTIEQKAKAMGLNPATVGWVIQTRGAYKQPSPELRTEYRIQDRQHRARLRAAHLL
jgi:hypothetical protein